MEHTCYMAGGSIIAAGRIVLRLDDPAVVEMLSSEDHYRLGLFLVHPNYHRFQPSKK